MTLDELKNAQFRATVFADGAKGMSLQIYACVEEPRVTVRWMRKDRRDKGTKTIYVDCNEVANLEEAIAKLNAEK
jgi:hypothetical protein